MEPILKWAGGKRQLLSRIGLFIDEKKIIDTNATYYEPFFGGGSVCLNMMLPKCIVNDVNSELINVYIQIKEHPKELMDVLKKHKEQHSAEYYYFVRNKDREPDYEKENAINRAARIIYLNRTCYNGLYRVNSKGQFNVPVGRQGTVEIVMSERIIELSQYLNNADVKLLNCDFEESVKTAKEGDFIYFDPPYDYEDEKGFTSYVVDGFDRKQLVRLRKCADELIERGCEVLISNNDTTYIRDQFSAKEYDICQVNANRSINRNAQNRTGAKEVLIYGKRK